MGCVIMVVLASRILRSILDLDPVLRGSRGVFGAFFLEMITWICYVFSACASTVDLCSHVWLRSSRYSHIFYVFTLGAWTLFLDPVLGSHTFGICCLSSTSMLIIRIIPGGDFRTVSEFSALLGSTMGTRSCVSSLSLWFLHVFYV